MVLLKEIFHFPGFFDRNMKWCCDDAKRQLFTLLLTGFCFTKSLFNFDRFAGKMDRPQAETELRNKSDGTFLIRESVNRSGEYALSVK